MSSSSDNNNPSIYSKHFTNPEEVAAKWSTILENHLGIRQAKNCVSFSMTSSSASSEGDSKNNKDASHKSEVSRPESTATCALPQGWTVDYTEKPIVEDDIEDSKENESEPSNKKQHLHRKPEYVLKSLQPRTTLFPDHPKKGDCLVANQNIPAGTTIITEPSLLSTPQEPSLFLLAASSAKAIENRSKEHLVVSRAAAAAASLIQVCYQNTSEDSAGGGGAKSGATNRNGPSSFGIFRSVCPQWTASLVFVTLVRIGMTNNSFSGENKTGSSASKNASSSNSNSHHHLLESFFPGWEVTSTFSACSCGGKELPIPEKPGSSVDESNLERFQDEICRINEYRSSRWSEWTCAAKMIHRLFLAKLQQQRTTTSKPPSVFDKTKLAHKLLTETSVKSTFDPELLCSIALDLNGFLTSATIESFITADGGADASRRHRFLNTKSAGVLTKPAQRLAYFFDAVSSNCIEVGVPGIPKRLAVFSHARLCEHECRPACSVSFLDSPTLQSSSSFIAGTQLQWDDPIHGCLVAGGLRQQRHLEQDRKKGIVGEKSEINFTKSAAGHDVENYGGAAAVNLILVPAVICVSSIRDIPYGDGVSIQYTSSTLMTRHERQRDLISKYGFKCSCIWCVGFAPDLARAFRCPNCPKGQGVVCPRADGSQLTLWECIQCGHHPDVHFIDRCCDSEAEMFRMKTSNSIESSFGNSNPVDPKLDAAEKLRKLVDDEYLHYSHAHVCRKLDFWAEKAYRQQDAELCISIVEVLLRCIDRLGNDDVDGFAAVMRGGVNKDKNNNHQDPNNSSNKSSHSNNDAPAGVILPFISENRAERRGPSKWDKNPPRDIMLAQYLELLGKSNHAVGNAHTSRYYYSIALAIRERCGQALSWWCRATRFMAVTKSLADLMDSK